MNLVTDKYEDWIRAHLPKSYENEPIDCFHECYLDGLTIMQLGERGGPDEVVYAAEDEDDLRRWKEVLSPERWEKKVRTHVDLMNRWFKKDHWGYDREKLCFVEISDCKEYASDFDDTEEPRPGSIIEVVD